MPESPLDPEREPTALHDLEALIADRAKRESETELGFGRREDREEKDYQAASQQLAEQVQGRRRDAQGRVRAEAPGGRRRPSSATPRPSEDEYAEAKQQADDQFKKEQRRAKKIKEEAGWQALAFFEGTRDEAIKWRRATEANWSAAIQDLHVNQETAEVLLKRFGRHDGRHARRGRGHPGRPRPRPPRPAAGPPRPTPRRPRPRPPPADGPPRTTR